MTCPERGAVCAETVASFRRTDWKGDLQIVEDDRSEPEHLRGIAATWGRMLARAAAAKVDVVLLMEDDLDFSVHLMHNLRCWAPLRASHGGGPFFGSLYNPGRAYTRRDDSQHFLVADPRDVWGSQAVLTTPAMAAYFLSHWDEETGAADLKMPRLAARVCPVYYHVPSLVQHVGHVSTWGGMSHQAVDFDRFFRADPPVTPGRSDRATASVR